MMRIALILLFASCSSSSPLPAGAVCKSSSECELGLDCLDVAQISGSACTVVGKSCSLPCTDNASCSSLGSNFMCFATCTTDKDCQMTQ